MREMAIRALLLIICVSTSRSYGQVLSRADDNQLERMNRLVEEVHKRVNDAAEAATYVVKADEHRRQAEQMSADGQHQKARAELELAAEIIAAADRPAIQGDSFLQDYASELRYALNTLGSVKEQAAKTGVSTVDTATALSFIKSTLIANALPPQLTAVVMVESEWDANALSPKGARGLWQLMPDTARRYGLRVNERLDERVDPIKSTYAAVRYLRDLYTLFGDWPLVLAGYNAGESRIAQIMARSGVRDFWAMRAQGLLPTETSRYVPAVLAAAPILRQGGRIER